MKLTRWIVILGLAAVFMPSPPPGDPLLQTAAGRSDATMRGADPAELAYAAMAAASDAGSFCSRQPQACEIAGRFWADFTLRLRYTLRLTYQWATGQEGQAAPSSVPAAPAGEMRAIPAAAEGVHEVKGRPARGLEQQVRPQPLDVETGRQRAKGASADPLITGSTRPASGKAPALRLAQRRSQERPEGSENTLTIEDILIPWNGPRQG